MAEYSDWAVWKSLVCAGGLRVIGIATGAAGGQRMVERCKASGGALPQDRIETGSMPDIASTRPAKLPSLDLGRFAAAFLVVLYHMGITVHNFTGAKPFDMAFRGGHSGVAYFFVLSGFIIVYVHRVDLGVSTRLANFARKRIVRIVPLLWLTMIGWGAIRLFVPGGTGNALQPDAILWDCLLLPHDSESVIGAVWTLRREAIFYLLFAVAIFDRRVGIALLVAWQLGVVIQAIHPFFALGPEPQMLLGIHNLGFGIGMLLALAIPARPLACHRLLITVGVLLYAGVMAAEWRYGSGVSEVDVGLGETLNTLAYLVASGLIVAGMVSRDILVPRPSSALGTKLGNSSYALYLTQGPVGSVAIRLFKPIWGLVPPEVLMLLLSATTVVAAIAINRLIEKPLVQLMRGRPPRLAPSQG